MAMRIGIVTPFFYPFDGGAERNALFLAKELAKKHHVEVFTSDRKDSNVLKKKYEILNGIQIHRCKTLFRYGHYFSIYPSIITKLILNKFDVIQVHGQGFFQQDLAVAIKKLFSPKTKFFNTPHGPFMALEQYKNWQKILKTVYLPLLNVINRIYVAAIAMNPTQQVWLKNCEFKETVLIPAGINQNMIAIKHKAVNSHQLCYVGRIQKYKGLDKVIKVLSELPKVKFVAIGADAGDKQRLEMLAKELGVADRVIFTGELSEKEKLEILDESAVFVFPSEWEAFGIAMLEAMARGLPIVSSKTEGGNFLIKNGENGYLFESKNLAELKNKLKMILSDKKLQETMSKNNIAKAKSFLWEKLCKDLEKLFLN
jgi:glycosyltransferase involved in cell wall biosynthesis